MPHALAHYRRREIVVLGLIECALSFAVIYAMIGTTGVPASLPDVRAAFAGNPIALAAELTPSAGAVAIAIGLYRAEVCLNRKRQLTAIGVAAAAGFTGLLFLGGGIPDSLTFAHPLYMAKVLLAWLAALTMIRLAYSFAMIRMPVSHRILILGDMQRAGGVRARLRSRRGRIFDPVVLHARELSWKLLQQQRIWAVVVASTPDATAVESLLACKLRGTLILGSAAFHEDYLGRIDLDTVTANDLLLGQGFTSSGPPAAAKRACDMGIAICMLILALPLMALTALAIKAGSPGPVFYRQQRTGQFDKPFMLFKFRSMAADAEACDTPRWAQQKDPRVTRVGRFIRATRIDELPQLVNVISGEMSLVGPRPERPHFVEQLERAIPFYRQRAYVKPGLTGWAQVNFPYGASVEDAREKLSYDLFYVKNRTILLDLVILLSTIRVVLFRDGAR
jgi:exopolysaccharide biosynthesis polyprenyl glycosylphosphotransferase